MTKDDLQKELQEKVKEGVKPSDIRRLKRSKSLNDLSPNPNQEIFYEASEDNPAELKAQISELEDQILTLRLEKIKEFGEYYEKKQELEKDLESNVNYGVKEINRLENKLRTINKKKLELQEQLSQVQGKNARLELKLIDEQNKEIRSSKRTSPLAPNSDWWIEYGPTILLLTLTALAIWLLNKSQVKQSFGEANYHNKTLW